MSNQIQIKHLYTKTHNKNEKDLKKKQRNRNEIKIFSRIEFKNIEQILEDLLFIISLNDLRDDFTPQKKKKENKVTTTHLC